MSFFGSIGNAIKKGVTGVGHAIGSIASNPIVEGAAGLLGGPVLGGIVGGAGRLLAPGGNLGKAAGGALTGALAGGVGRALGGAVSGAGGLSGAARTLGSGLLGGGLRPTGTFAPSGSDMYSHIIDYDAGGNPIFDNDGGQGGGLSLGGILGGAGRLLGGGQGGMGGLGNLLTGGLAGYQAINAANASKRAGQLQDKALGLADQRWSDTAPLRAAGTARLLNAQNPDLSSVFANPTNPFAARPRLLGGG